MKFKDSLRYEEKSEIQLTDEQMVVFAHWMSAIHEMNYLIIYMMNY